MIVRETYLSKIRPFIGKDIIKVFSQVGYEWGDDANYDGERAAQEMLKSMN